MGISVDSVRRYIHRGRERIRQKVYQEEKDDE
jgi:DNA-directed RNA polymerase specialized sigma24 family protein